MENTGSLLLIIAVLIVAIVGVVYLTLSAKRPKLHVEKYQTRWLEIENSVSRDNAASWHLAVMNADKLLDQALRESHYQGKTMGERMRSAGKVWSNANHVWSAHKVRNQLAHESDFRPSYDLTLRTLTALKQALKDLGAI